MVIMRMTLDQVRAKHPDWRIQPYHRALLCSWGPFQFVAANPDYADMGIESREATPCAPGTVGHLMQQMGEPLPDKEF